MGCEREVSEGEEEGERSEWSEEVKMRGLER
jgi:hypothetical protein